MKSRVLLIVLFYSITVFGQKYVADYTIAKQEVLRQIPKEYIHLAKKNLRVAYQHTSHGTHVAYGIYGLMDFKPGDDTLFAVSNSTTANKLEFHDYALSSYATNGIDASDLSRNETAFIQATRNYLNDSDNAEINVIMWSWCDINGHQVSRNYLPGMDSLISEYSIGGSKIGTGNGQRENPVTFIYMTGHGNANYNIGDGRAKNQADLIVTACNNKKQFCLDYFSIDAHDMNDNYWNDAGDNGQSSAYGGNFYHDFQNASSLGINYYENKKSIGGSVAYGQHNDQHITANRKAYAMWWILARIAGWDGLSDSKQDSVAPSIPTNLQTTFIGNTQVSLSWDASSDNTSVAYYEIYRADVKVGETTLLTFQDTKLNPGTTYNYSVIAVDNFDNESAPSKSVTATTLNKSASSVSQKEGIQTEVKCFPSPSHGLVNIQFTLDKAENIEIVIINILGKVVRRQYINNPIIGEHLFEFDISDQAKGIYIYQIRTPESLVAGKIHLTN